jgi:hypothetical protein
VKLHWHIVPKLAGSRAYRFSGLLGTGKTTLAQALARTLNASYLRIDTIEDQLLADGGHVLVASGAGYRVAYAMAENSSIPLRSRLRFSKSKEEMRRDGYGPSGGLCGGTARFQLLFNCLCPAMC